MDCPRHGSRRMKEEGAYRWCDECAWEAPTNPAEVPSEPEVNVEPETESIGTKDLARMCSARVKEIEGALEEAERRHKEKVATARAELARLRKIIAFCADEPKATKAAVARNPGDSKNAWTRPDCGHRTVSRWVQRHKDTECPRRASA